MISNLLVWIYACSNIFLWIFEFVDKIPSNSLSEKISFGEKKIVPPRKQTNEMMRKFESCLFISLLLIGANLSAISSLHLNKKTFNDVSAYLEKAEKTLGNFGN